MNELKDRVIDAAKALVAGERSPDHGLARLDDAVNLLLRAEREAGVARRRQRLTRRP